MSGRRRLRVALQHLPVLVDAVEDGGRDGEHHAGRVEAARRQDVMDEIAVDAAVAVLERVNEDEAEGQDRGGNDRIELRGLVRSKAIIPSIRDGRSSARALIWSGIGVRAVPVMLADKAAFRAQAQIDKAVVADDDLLQAQELVEIDRLAAGLADGAAPALHAVLRRVLAFDDVARAGILQQQERGGAREQIGRHIGGHFLGAVGEIERDELLERRRAEHERAEFRRAGQVVADAVAGGIPAGARPLLLGIEGVDVGDLLRDRED